jgi:hypothetical protein
VSLGAKDNIQKSFEPEDITGGKSLDFYPFVSPDYES